MAAKEEDVKAQPLVIFYDSEAANGNVYCGDIIEIAAKCHPDVVKGSFRSLINTKQPLCAFAARDCGLSQDDLRNKPYFREVFQKFLFWIDGMVKSARKKHGKQFLPVLCAHHGYQFDFLILLNNMERFGIHHSVLTQLNIHFADSLVFCHELKDNGEKLLANTRLSLEALHKKFFPKKIFKDRHRAMGDVDGMVKIFTQTPLRKLLHLMKYSSTKERLEYYISQCGRKQQRAILEEKLCKLDACSKNMSIKKLLKEGVTYNSLRRIFEDCCSFMDFFEVMKTYGIERKVSKVMALHFGGLGLQNQGLTAYSYFYEEKPNQASAESRNAESKPQPNVVSVKTPEDDRLSEKDDGTEDWERDLVRAAPRSNFTLKCNTPAPLSLDLDDLYYAHSEKKIGVESLKGKLKSEITNSSRKSEGELSLSESKNVEVVSNSSRGKSPGAHTRKGSSDSAPHAPKQRGEKTVKRRKSFGNNKADGMLFKEVTFSEKDNKREVTPMQSKPINPPRSDNYVKNNKPSLRCSYSNEHKPETELKEQPFDRCRSLTECSEAKLQPTEISDAKSDPSTANLEQKFASVLIGDITILVPFEYDGEDCDSNVTAASDPEAHTQEKSRELSSTQESRVVDSAPVVQSVQGLLETHVGDLTEEDSFDPNEVITSLHQNCELPPDNSMMTVAPNFPSENGQSLPKSSESAHETCSEKQLESCNETTLKSSFVVSGVRSGRDTCHALPSSLDFDQSPENALVQDQVTCVGEEKANVSIDLQGVETSVDNSIPLVNLSSSGFQVSTSIFETNGNSIHEACSTNESPCLNSSTVERNSGLTSSWTELSCAYLPNNALLSSSLIENPSLGNCGINQGFTSDLTSTESAIQARGDFPAELSSEGSSFSDNQSVDEHTFSRQPPLGEERLYTPDTAQQQSNQLPLAGNARDAIAQQPTSPGLNYSQASFPSLLANPHGTFYQGYPALPLLKPCYPSFVFSSPIRPVIAPHLMQQPHPQEVFIPPLQYRNQMMFTNLAPPSLGLPPVPQAQLQPQLFPFFQAATAFPCSSRVNPYEQAQQAAGPPVDVSGQLVFTHSAIALSQGGPVASDYPVPKMDSRGSHGSFVDFSSDTSSIDGSFEGVVTSLENHTDDNFKSFLDKADNDFGYTSTVAYRDNHREPAEDFKEKNPLTGNTSDSQIFTLAQLCHMKVSGGNISASQQHCESQEDPVHKQVLVLSREESVMEMGRRLSPDGSSVEGVCLDSSSNNFKDEFSKEASAPPSDWDILSKECCGSTPTGVEEQKNENSKDTGPFPKPQRIKGKRSRGDIGTRGSSVLTSSHNDLHPGSEQVTVTCLIMNEQSSTCESNNNSPKLEDSGLSCVNDCSLRLKTRKNHRRVRFSKQDSARCRESSSSLQQPFKQSMGGPASDVWKRGLSNKLQRPFKEKSSRKAILEDKVAQAGTKTDKNNNS